MGFSRQEYWSGVPLPSQESELPAANYCSLNFTHMEKPVSFTYKGQGVKWVNQTHPKVYASFLSRHPPILLPTSPLQGKSILEKHCCSPSPSTRAGSADAPFTTRPSSPPSKAHVPSTFASISDIPFAHILSCAFAGFISLLPLHLGTWCALGSPVLLSRDVIPLHLWYFCSHSPNYSYLTIVTSKFKSATLFPLWIPYPNSQRLQLFQISTHSFRFLSCLLGQHLPPCFTSLPDTCVLTTWVSAHLSAQ